MTLLTGSSFVLDGGWTTPQILTLNSIDLQQMAANGTQGTTVTSNGNGNGGASGNSAQGGNNTRVATAPIPANGNGDNITGVGHSGAAGVAAA